MLLEPISGHRRLSGKDELGPYLEYNKGPDGGRAAEWGVRALATDLINVCDLRRSGGPTWYQTMDDTRETYGNDKPVKGKQPLTYKQYVMSPDPKDDCSLETLRECATQWARKWFSDYEVAIVYHDDNENGIIHAHIVVNNTNLETGRRLGPYLTAKRVKDMNRSCQRIAIEHGLSAFDKDHVSRSAVEFSDRDPERAAVLDDGTGAPSKKREATRAKARRGPLRGRPGDKISRPRSMAERTMLAEGKRTWKQELADLLDAALMVSSSELEFVAACVRLGLAVTESVAAAVDGRRPELLFGFPGRGRLIRGSRLAPRFSRAELTLRFALAYGELVRATTLYVMGTVPAPRELRATVIGSTMVVAHMGRPGEVPLADFTAMLRFNAAHGIAGYDDYARVGGAEAARMERVARRCKAFGDGDGSAAESLDRFVREAQGKMAAAAAARAAASHGGAAQQTIRRPGADVPGDGGIGRER